MCASSHTVFENRQKVAFNIASEASYVYISSGQKFIKNAKNGTFWRFFEKLTLADRSLLIGQKLMKNAKNRMAEVRHFG